MKKLFIGIFVMLSTFAYSQISTDPSTDLSTAIKVKASMVDSIIMMPNVTKVDVSSSIYKDKFTHYASTIFKVEGNFLILDNSYYFDLNKVIAFRRVPKVLEKGDLIEFYFE